MIQLLEKRTGAITHKYFLICPPIPLECSSVDPSGCGKTNTLMHMLYKLPFFDKIYLYAKNLEQPKYRELLETFAPISEEVGYDVIEESSDEIIPLEGLHDDNQKIVIFDDFVCEKN